MILFYDPRITMLVHCYLVKKNASAYLSSLQLMFHEGLPLIPIIWMLPEMYMSSQES